MQNRTYDMKTFKYTKYKINLSHSFKSIYSKLDDKPVTELFYTFEVLDIFVDPVYVFCDCFVNDLQGGVHPHHRGQQGRRDQADQGQAQHYDRAEGEGGT